MAHAIEKAGQQFPVQYGGTEFKSRNVLGPVSFTLCDLRISGSAEAPADPDTNVAPAQSPYIIAANESFDIEVDIEFNNSPLTRLLLCLGTKMTMCFSFEGVGAKAIELDLEVSEVTVKDETKYTLTWSGTPEEAGLTAGFYGIAGVATIGPVEHPCAPKCAMGYGYIAGLLLQVYEVLEAC